MTDVIQLLGELRHADAARTEELFPSQQRADLLATILTDDQAPSATRKRSSPRWLGNQANSPVADERPLENLRAAIPKSTPRSPGGQLPTPPRRRRPNFGTVAGILGATVAVAIAVVALTSLHHRAPGTTGGVTGTTTTATVGNGIPLTVSQVKQIALRAATGARDPHPTSMSYATGTFAQAAAAVNGGGPGQHPNAPVVAILMHGHFYENESGVYGAWMYVVVLANGFEAMTVVGNDPPKYPHQIGPFKTIPVDAAGSGAVTGSVPPFVSNTGLAIVSLYAKGPHQSLAERKNHPGTPRPVGPLIRRLRLTPADNQFTVRLAPGVYDGEIRVPKGSFGGGCPWGPGPTTFRVRSGQTTHLQLVRCGHSY